MRRSSREMRNFSHLIVAVIVEGVLKLLAVLAALLHKSFWLEHSSTEKRGPEIPTQASN
jgi:hypothetical protein